ncbi:MAG: hypothetical protein ACI89X_002951 [Planctomycetota bacterium]|jgi:hypothetical protein
MHDLITQAQTTQHNPLDAKRAQPANARRTAHGQKMSRMPVWPLMTVGMRVV